LQVKPRSFGKVGAPASPLLTTVCRQLGLPQEACPLRYLSPVRRETARAKLSKGGLRATRLCTHWLPEDFGAAKLTAKLVRTLAPAAADLYQMVSARTALLCPAIRAICCVSTQSSSVEQRLVLDTGTASSWKPQPPRTPPKSASPVRA
jgi:hypothetical protein